MSNNPPKASWLKQCFILFLGFASGLPLALSGQSMQAWLTVDKIDIATIGFFSLVGLPYTFKFLWAPLMDRFEPPVFGRRRGWLVITQMLLCFLLTLMSRLNPGANTALFALCAAAIAFMSASQDVVIDAYRTDALASNERGLGSSMTVFGYRLAMILSGGIAFVWADPVSGNGWSWPDIYNVMAFIMGIAALVSALFVPGLGADKTAPKTVAKNDVLGFLAVFVSVAVGYFFWKYLATPVADLIVKTIAGGSELSADAKKWSDLFALLFGIAFTIPLAWWASRKAKFETLNNSLQNYFSIKGAYSFLAFIILYKLGDAFAGSLLLPFLLKGVGFAQAEIGVVNKLIGMWLTIFGAIAGGAIMLRIGLYRSLFVFGILQMVSNVGLWIVAVLGKGAWGSFPLPPFDFYIVSLKETANVDWLLLTAIGSENIAGGMGTAAFVAFLMALCNQKFTATQYALLSAFSSVGRVWVGPLAGVLAVSIGWAPFYIFAICMALPGLFMLYRLRDTIRALEQKPS
ncbi:MAG: AmpG family muropeptide MFS transporter [Pseudobdellovibrio sp.]